MKSKDHVYSQIESSGKLPALPEVLLSLLTACDDPDSSIADIATIIERDPSLSLRVLQLVNSAYYGFRHSFTGIDQAVVYLGANTIKNLAVTTSVHQVFAQKHKGATASFDTGAFWYHSLMCATLARRISLAVGTGNADEAYLAGLLHDIGKFLLVSAFLETYAAIPVKGLSGPDQLLLESERVGTNHCEAGSWLIRQWNLGSMVADAIQYHHEPLTQVCEAFPLVKIVYFANILAGGEARNQPEDIGKVLFGKDICDFPQLVESCVEEVEQIATSMGVTISSPHNSGYVAGGGLSLAEDGENHSPDKTIAHAEAIRTTMAARVRNISLLSTFQEDLLQAENIEGILSSFEKAMTIQLGLGKVMFFLPDSHGMLLSGRTSSTNSLYEICRGLTFPVAQSASRIVAAFQKKSQFDYLRKEQNGASIADQQILTLFRCSKAYTLPLVADNCAVGVVLLGLDESPGQLTEEDTQLIGILAQQVALRLHLEQEKIRKGEALEKARTEAISTAARKLAHEINNPLGIISNYLMTLRLKLSSETHVLDELTIIDEEIQRISAMVSQMEMYSQAPFSQFSPIDVNSLVKDIIQIVRTSLFRNPGLTVSFIPGTDVSPVTTSKDGLKQIIINLLKNAAEAMEEGGRVLVRIRKSKENETAGQDGVEIIVADSGPGLPERVQENLYKPFVTTKENGHSGLGLSIVQKIVTDIGGTLNCVSSAKEGTTFTVFLPYSLPNSQ